VTSELIINLCGQSNFLQQWQEACIYLWAMSGDHISK